MNAYVLATVVVVIVVDAARASRLLAGGRPQRQRRARLQRAPLRQRPGRARWRCSSACSLARAGHPDGDAVAALFVAVLVLAAAGRLMRTNIDVLMDRTPGRGRRGRAGRDRGPRARR